MFEPYRVKRVDGRSTHPDKNYVAAEEYDELLDIYKDFFTIINEKCTAGCVHIPSVRNYVFSKIFEAPYGGKSV